jgi:hypothetical protein
MGPSVSCGATGAMPEGGYLAFGEKEDKRCAVAISLGLFSR